MSTGIRTLALSLAISACFGTPSHADEPNNEPSIAELKKQAENAAVALAEKTAAVLGDRKLPQTPWGLVEQTDPSYMSSKAWTRARQIASEQCGRHAVMGSIAGTIVGVGCLVNLVAGLGNTHVDLQAALYFPIITAIMGASLGAMPSLGADGRVYQRYRKIFWQRLAELGVRGIPEIESERDTWLKDALNKKLGLDCESALKTS